MDNQDLYVVIETGGSLGEIHNLGRNRIVGNTMYCDKEAAKKVTRSMANEYGGGYYNYHYSTKTLKWAIKNCKQDQLLDLILK